MGYYNGGGIVSGGSDVKRTLRFMCAIGQGAYVVTQRAVSTIIKFPGVSLQYAGSKRGTASLTGVSGGSGTLAWVVPECEGSQTDYSYSQIGDSNLYELVETNNVYTAAFSSSGGRNLT